MRPRVSWTTGDDRRLIIDEAFALLENVGMRFGACDALESLAEAGARVDREAGVARLPRELVERALAGCPREVLLAGATAEQDVVLDGSTVYFLPSGTPTKILDDETGLVRSSTVDDLRRAAIVADAMPVVDVMWPPVGAADVPEDEMELTELLTVLEWSGKHLQHEVTAPWHVEPMLAIMSEVCGGLDAYRARPRVSFVCCTHSPLGVAGPSSTSASKWLAWRSHPHLPDADRRGHGAGHGRRRRDDERRRVPRCGDGDPAGGARGTADHGRRRQPARHEGRHLQLRRPRDGAHVCRVR
jgi:trimethylamine:corrinoid methyltransferase-like protein